MMYNLLMTSAMLLCWIGTSSSQDPDFRCDFNSGECNIVQHDDDQGYWRRRLGEYLAEFDHNSNQNDTVMCYLPGFKSRAGNMTFRYRADADGHLEVSVCADGSDVRSFSDTSNVWTDVKMDIYSCTALMNISLTAVQDDTTHPPAIRVDDITVFEIFLPSTTTSVHVDKTAVVISVTVVVIVLVIIAIAVFFVVTRRRRMASQEKARLRERQKSQTDNAYGNATFSPEIPNPVHTPYPPDLLQELERSPNAIDQVPDYVRGSSASNSKSADVVKPPIGSADYSYAYAYPDQSQVKALQGIVGDEGALKDRSYKPLTPKGKPKGDATKGNQNVRNERKGRDANCEPDGNDYYILEQTTGSHYHPGQKPVDKPTSSQHLKHDERTPTAHPGSGYGVVIVESQGEGTYNVLDHGGVSVDVNGARKPQEQLRKGAPNEVDSEYNTLGLVDEGDRQFHPTPDSHDAYGVLDQNPVTVASGSSNHGNTYNVLHQTSKTAAYDSGRQTSQYVDKPVVDDYNVLRSGKKVGGYHRPPVPSPLRK